MKTRIVFREEKKIDAPDSVCELSVRGTVLTISDMLVYERDRHILVIELTGRWYSLGGEQDEAGDRIGTTQEIEKVTVVRNVLVAPRMVVEAANIWFADAPSLLAGKARAEAAQALAEAASRQAG